MFLGASSILSVCECCDSGAFDQVLLKVFGYVQNVCTVGIVCG